MTGDPQLLKSIYQKHIPGQVDKYYIVFYSPIGTTKEKIQAGFHSYAHTLEYQRHDQNCF